MGGGKVLLLNLKWSEHEQKSLAVFKYEMLYRYNIINHILTMQMWREGTNRSHWAPHTALCSPCKQKTQIQTLINYIFTVGVAGGASQSTSSSDRQTALIFSLQNMQYLHWHLQATFKKGKKKDSKKKKRSVSLSAKMPSESGAQRQNINSLIIKCLRWASTNSLLLCFVNIGGFEILKFHFTLRIKKKECRIKLSNINMFCIKSPIISVVFL